MTDREFTELMEALQAINGTLEEIRDILVEVEKGKSALLVQTRKS